MTGRALPNLNPDVAPYVPIAALPEHTFGLKPEVWWMFFRRDLAVLKVNRMNDAQWRVALDIARHRKMRPYKAATTIAAIPSRPRRFATP